MQFYPLPVSGKAQTTKQMIQDAQSVNITPGIVGAFANQQDWIAQTQVGPPNSGSAKYWRDNSAIFNSSKTAFYYLELARKADGSVDGYTVDQMASDPAVYSQGAVRFYQQYAGHFPLIPRIAFRSLERNDAMRISFAPGVPMSYPLAVPKEALVTIPDASTLLNPADWNFNDQLALRFNPVTGWPEGFRWAEYVAENPLDWRPHEAPPALTDGELVAAVRQIMSSGMSIADTAKAIRSIAAGNVISSPIGGATLII